MKNNNEQYCFDDNELSSFIKNIGYEHESPYPTTPNELSVLFFPDKTTNDIDFIKEKIKEIEDQIKNLNNKQKRKIVTVINSSISDTEKNLWLKLIDIDYKKQIKNHKSALYTNKSIANKLTNNSGLIRINHIIQNHWLNNLEQIKQVPITTLIPNQKFKQSGNKLSCLCPFHQEKTPSFVIYQDTNTYYCFGCSQGGDNISLIKLIHDLNFKEAIEYISNYL